MITARTTRLIRVRDLAAFRAALRDLAIGGGVGASRARAVVVPTRTAAEQLRRTLEERALASRPAAIVMPHLVTRDQWRARLTERLGSRLRVLSAHEREALLGAAARQAAEDAPPPFSVRPALLADMLRFYDGFRRQLTTVEAFERLAAQRYEPDLETDGGARRLMGQTRFMAAAYRGYEARIVELGACDEHLIRQHLIDEGPATFTHVIVAVGDRAGDGHGLWKADFDLLARMPGLERVDVLATSAMLASGFDERVQQHLPGIEDVTFTANVASPRLALPPGEGPRHFVFRDREEELRGVARRVKRAGREPGAAPLYRTAIVFRQPLPYVYLAGQVLPAAGIPYQAFDALPLGSEAYAAAVARIFECVDTAFARGPLVSLLRSPAFLFEVAGQRLSPADVSALDRELSDARYLGDLPELRRLAAAWAEPPEPSPSVRRARSQAAAAVAARAATAVVEDLCALLADAPPTAHLDTLLAFLRARNRVPTEDDDTRGRMLRARAAILGSLAGLRDAHRRHDDQPRPFRETAAAIRRWIGQQTFAPRRGHDGIQLLDADAARFGEFDTIYLVGLTQADWPGSERRNIFYRASVLADLGWPAEADARSADRATFDDLLRSASRETVVSTFTLEYDSLVDPSPFLEDLAQSGLAEQRDHPHPPGRVFVDEALVEGSTDGVTLPAPAAAWLAARAGRTIGADDRFRGRTFNPGLDSYKVSSLDTYLACPFAYFSANVLRLEEDPDDEESLGPRAQGSLVHDVLQRFYAAWQAAGHGAITAGNLADARALFKEMTEAVLGALPEADAALLRTRLLGSPVSPGIGDTVFRIEAERSEPVVQRLLEFKLDGDAVVRSEAGPRHVSLRAVADRIDLLADGTFRLIDYKLSRAPSATEAVQLPAYAASAVTRLRERDGQTWTASDAAYITFGRKAYAPLSAEPSALDARLREGELRLVGVVDAIERGEFPARPKSDHRCSYCPFSSVCRKDIADGD